MFHSHASLWGYVRSGAYPRHKELGVKLGEGKTHCTSNLRLARDVTLMATSLRELIKMMTDFTRSTTKHGLAIHLDKTKRLTNQGSDKHKEMDIAGIRTEILPPDGKVKMVNIRNLETVEIAHRLRCVWSAFAFTTKVKI